MTMNQSFRQLLANDGYAVTFQTMGQYRTALLAALDKQSQVMAVAVEQLLAAAKEALMVIGRIRPEGHGRGTEVRLQRAISAFETLASASPAALTLPDTDLIKACRRAVLALAHASECMPQYNADYQALSDTIEGYVAAQPAEPTLRATLDGARVEGMKAALEKAEELCAEVAQGELPSSRAESAAYECVCRIRRLAAQPAADARAEYDDRGRHWQSHDDGLVSRVEPAPAPRQGVALSEQERESLREAIELVTVHGGNGWSRTANALSDILSRASSSRAEVENIKALVDRFLTWPVPASVYPDGMPGKPGRTGTNLLSALEAEEMFRYVLAAAEAHNAEKEKV
jgi:hypothetical protein